MTDADKATIRDWLIFLRDDCQCCYVDEDIISRLIALLDAPKAPTQDDEVPIIHGRAELEDHDRRIRDAVVEECKAVLDKFTGFDAHCKDGWGIIKLSPKVIAALGALKGGSYE